MRENSGNGLTKPKEASKRIKQATKRIEQYLIERGVAPKEAKRAAPRFASAPPKELELMQSILNAMAVGAEVKREREHAAIYAAREASQGAHTQGQSENIPAAQNRTQCATAAT